MSDVKRAIGDAIAGYTVTGILGQGGSGAVYRVEDDDGQEWALKLVNAKADSVAGQRLAREVQALQSLRHPAVPQVVDLELDGDVTFVVFELVDGQSLFHHIHDHGPLAGDGLANFAEITAQALEAVHAAGVVHRDVTPSNVMMGADGPVLIDFGLSHKRYDARLTREGLVSGTAGYVAPEVIDGEEPGPEADCWSWAATVVFAMTGEAPFGTGNGAIGRTLKGNVSLPDVPGADALVAALGKDIEARPGPRDVVAALRGARIELPPMLTEVAEPGDDAGAEGDVEEWLPGDWDGYDEGDDDFGPPIHRSATLIAWTGAIALSAALAPLVAAGSLLVSAAIARTVHRHARILHDRRRRRGARRLDAVVMTLSTPWQLARAIAEVAVAWVVGAAIGVGVSAAIWQLTVAGAFGDDARLGEATALAMGALATALFVWWGPLSAPTRDGGHRVAAAFAPTRALAAVWVIIALAGIAVVGWYAVGLGLDAWWWPWTEPLLGA